MLNAEIIKAILEEYYPISRIGWCREIADELNKRGLPDEAFMEMLKGFIKNSDRLERCPTWRHLKHYLPKRAKGPWNGATLHGVFIRNLDDYNKIIALTSCGCNGHKVMRKYNLKEQGDCWIEAATVLNDCAANDEERRRAGLYLQRAIVEREELQQRIKKRHDGDLTYFADLERARQLGADQE